MKGDFHARAGRRKPVRQRQLRNGGQAHGPQHQVKPAASTELQSGGRAAHVTAKATSSAGAPKPVNDSGGVWGAARVQGEVRNTRDPSAQSRSRQGGSYKPKAKSSAAQRESEGRVVPLIAVTNNAAGGKAPCFGQAWCESKREGMAARSGPKDPGAGSCGVQVRQPQSELRSEAERHCTSSSSPIRRAQSDACVRGRGPDGCAVVHAPSGGPSVSRVPEIGTHGLNGGPAFLLLVNPG
jgi:Tfp pilus assembly protein FimV